MRRKPRRQKPKSLKVARVVRKSHERRLHVVAAGECDIQLDGNSLTLPQVEAIARHRAQVGIPQAQSALLKRARQHIDKAAKGQKSIYSINTGFGVLSKVRIASDKLLALQKNLILSHCVGVGELHDEAETRAIMLLRTNVLAKGMSGVRPEVPLLLVEMLNRGICPSIPCKGSVGASGDLAPLAHLASVLIGHGEALWRGDLMPGHAALSKAGLSPLTLQAKEGLALINGTQQMTAVGALLAVDAVRAADFADWVCALSVEGILGTPVAFDPWIQEQRGHAGQKISASRILSHLTGSEIRESHKNCDRVQDPYSFRCAPQVHGACRDLISFASSLLERELNAATDNPLLNPDTGELLSNGNFHGQPVAFALDILGMAISELGSLSERRIAKLLDPAFSGLPCFLVQDEGLNSGFMMAQATAASLVAESKLLTHPASTDSIPTNNEKEDHVSMGPLAALKAKTILRNTQTILAIEALAAAQAVDFRKPLKPGQGAKKLHRRVREKVPGLDTDRALSPDINAILDGIRSGEFLG